MFQGGGHHFLGNMFSLHRQNYPPVIGDILSQAKSFPAPGKVESEGDTVTQAILTP